ncbi:MAG: FkbM family methyltransferase [Nitrososphaerota archaeon]|nr:FkbM family methyltransferase [Nitrososphaerota archaeon]
MTGSLTPTEWNIKSGLVTPDTILVDTLIDRLGLSQVDIVKMDIEGTEHAVLTDDSLDLSMVKNIIVEVHYNYDSPQSREIVEALRRKGFKTMVVHLDPSRKSCHLLAYREDPPW